MSKKTVLEHRINASANLSATFDKALNTPMSLANTRKAARLLLSLDKWVGGGLTPEQKAQIFKCFPDIRPMTRNQLVKAETTRASNRV